MKRKVMAFLSILFCLFFVCGCTDLGLSSDQKTEFYLNEEATIDHFQIVLNDIAEADYFQDVRPEKDLYLVLEFKITNTSSEEKVIQPIDSFQLMIDEVPYTDLNHNKDVTLEANESIMYQAIFDVPEQDIYQVLFYSGVVSNNIKFVTK